MARGKCADHVVKLRPGLTRARLRAEILQLLQGQDVARMNGIGIAAQGLDLGDAERRRAQLQRRARLWAPDGGDLVRTVEAARQCENVVAAPLAGREGIARQRFEPLQEPRGHGGRAATLAGAADDDARRAHRHGEIMRRLADAPLGGRQAKLGAHRAVEESAGLCLRRPDGFVEPCEQHHVGIDEPRLQEAEDLQAWMRAHRTAHDLFSRHQIDERAIIDGAEGDRRIGLVGQFGEQGLEDVVALVLRRRLLRGRVDQRRQSRAMGRDPCGERGVARRVVERCQRAVQGRHQMGERIPVGTGDARAGGVGVAVGGQRTGGGDHLERPVAVRQHAAQHCNFQQSGEPLDLGAGLAEPGQRMGEQSQPLGGHAGALPAGEREARQHAIRRGRQRLAAGIVDGNVPACEIRPHAPRQRAIRRDQGGGDARFLKRAAHAQGQRQRLLALVGGDDQLDTRERLRDRALAKGGGIGGPALRRVGGAEGLAQQRDAGGEGCVWCAEVHDIVARHAQRRQQAMQRGLRMARRRIDALVGVALDQPPGRLVERAVEARQHHGALILPRDGGQQARGGAIGAGRSDGDDRRACVDPCEPRDLVIDQPALPGRGIDELARVENVGPGLRGNAEKLDGHRPVAVEFMGGEVLQLRPVGILDDHLVDQRGEVAGEMPGLRRRARHQQGFALVGLDLGSFDMGDRMRELARPCVHQPHQDHPALDGAHRVGHAVHGAIACVKQQSRLDAFQMPERHDVRQQHGGAGQAADQFARQGARGAACRHIDGGGREIERRHIGADAVHNVAVQQMLREGRQERHAGMDGQDPGSARHSAVPQDVERAMAASACAMAAGVPTCSQTPSSRSPCRRPFSAAAKKKGARRNTSAVSSANSSGLMMPTPE